MSKFVTRKWIEINDFSGGQYSVNKNMRFKAPMLRLDLCDYSDAYVVVKRRITVDGTAEAKERNKKLTFKNNAPFISCMPKFDNKFIGNAEDLDIVMHMYNLLDYSEN